MTTTLHEPEPTVTPAAAPVAPADATLAISGMTCIACVARLEKVLGRQPGVMSASVSLPAERAEIRYDPALAGIDDLVAAVARAGFDGKPVRAEAPPAAGPTPLRDRLELAGAALLTLPLVLDMVLMLAGVPPVLPGWAQGVLATPVQFVAGARFYRGAWGAVRHGGANMDVLVVLGTSAAYGLSIWLVLAGHAGHGGHLYFEASALVITLVLAGKLLEARARRATNRAVEALVALRPETARVRRGGAETVIPADSVAIGDVLVVRPGERIPADAVVLEGRAALDESMVTGESRPRERGPGDPVVGGTIDLDGMLVLRATAVGAEAMLGRMIALVAHAQATKPRIQRLADTVSAWFALFVIAISLAAFAGWWFATGSFQAAVLPAVAVLVVACPCALGLATPAVIAVALGAGARHGILIRDAEVLERAHGVSLVVFDKTGTLTADRPDIAAVEAVEDTPDDLLRLAAALQQGSGHPIARAIREAAGQDGEPVADFRTLPGRGVAGSVGGGEGGRTLVMGNAALMAEQGIDTAALDRAAEAQDEAGRAVIWLAETAPRLMLLGFVALADRLRPGAAAAVARLHGQGVETLMLTGDTRAAAEATAARLGLRRVVAEASPSVKIVQIEAAQRSGAVVAMVGDGVNDGPALARADLGIAMGGGTEVAMHAAGVGLIRDDPTLVPAVIDLARATRRKIVQNLAWAFGFNALALPLAAFGYLPPAVAAIGMTVSSLAVVGNALLLQVWKPAGGEGVRA